MKSRDAVSSDYRADRGGKTALSLDLAERIGAEIVSADSRQIYRGMTIGTAKPTGAERARVPHHFVDEREPTNPISAGQFAREADARIEAMLRRGVVPLVVGGSMLYLDALVRGIANLPEADPEVLQAVREAGTHAEGREALFAELKHGDPRAAATLDPSKSQRLIRLVSVLRSSGPPSVYWDATPPPQHAYRILALQRPRPELYERINARVLRMVQEGLVAETEGLIARGFDPDRLPLRTIGYQEAAAHLRSDIVADEMIRLIQRNSRRYAKRQLTWLRRDPAIVWLHADASVDEVLAAVTTKSA